MEGAGFYEPLHQESFMKELQSLSKLVYTTAAVVCLMDGLLLDGLSLVADSVMQCMKLALTEDRLAEEDTGLQTGVCSRLGLRLCWKE